MKSALWYLLYMIFTVNFAVTNLNVFVPAKMPGYLNLRMQNILNSVMMFPNSFMILPVIAGVIVDSLGALNVIFLSLLVFFFGIVITGSFVVFEYFPGEAYGFFVDQIGVFFIGCSFQCLRVAIYAMLANTVMKKNSRDINPIFKAISFTAVGQVIGMVLPRIAFSLFSEYQLIDNIMYLLSWICVCIAVFYTVKMMREGEDMANHYRFMRFSDNLNMEQLRIKEELDNSWSHRNDLQVDTIAESLADFFWNKRWTFTLWILSRAYICAASDVYNVYQYISASSSLTIEQAAYLVSFLKLVLTFAFAVFVKWDRLRLQITTKITFGCIIVIYYLLQYYPGSFWGMVISYSYFSTFQLLSFVAYTPYWLDFDMTNVGKICGLVKWVECSLAIVGGLFNNLVSPMMFLLFHTIYMIDLYKGPKKKLKVDPEVSSYSPPNFSIRSITE
jgi:hypothetical protein